jgi:hypothetical protein
MGKQDRTILHFLKNLEELTDRHGSFSLASDAGKVKMKALVADLIEETKKQK